MKSEETPFEGGPLDGRVLPVLLGPTGHPPKVYRVPVPDGAGGPPTVLVYRRVQAGVSKRIGLHQGWKYAYDPTGRAGGIRWPWSKPDPAPGPVPDATPDGKPEDTHG
ncbi:hypothetical protein QFZ75_002579 [Streptomyces sp. V3I8]|uniref:hypothetical protein n=1 Tax=Streptomyces sp. V3I8 TaxID=3042279 RepID=UPI0027808C45|nr:hypothetical protein [Streptomyces sp. V3I8]MDQ1036163.1 hypothetical protein [Streptomyces sp. V3I8]